MARIWKFADDIDTDQIVPGRYAPYMRPNADVGKAAFIEARPDFNQYASPGDIIVAGKNFGCGSSREYAVEALIRRRTGAIIARSFARIFYRNCLNLGLPVFEDNEILDQVLDGDEVQIDIISRRIVVANIEYKLPKIPQFAQAILNAGGIVTYLKKYGHFPGEV